MVRANCTMNVSEFRLRLLQNHILIQIVQSIHQFNFIFLNNHSLDYLKELYIEGHDLKCLIEKPAVPTMSSTLATVEEKLLH